MPPGCTTRKTKDADDEGPGIAAHHAVNAHRQRDGNSHHHDPPEIPIGQPTSERRCADGEGDGDRQSPVVADDEVVPEAAEPDEWALHDASVAE